MLLRPILLLRAAASADARLPRPSLQRSLFCDCVMTSCGHRYCAGCVQGARDCPACGADIESLEPDEETQGLGMTARLCCARFQCEQLDCAMQIASCAANASLGALVLPLQLLEPCPPNRLDQLLL